MPLKLVYIFLAIVIGLSGSINLEASSRILIQNRGSDTLFNAAQAWSEAYKNDHPTVSVVVTGGGSGTGIADIINGTVDLANSSRLMLVDEIAKAKNHGVHPVEHTIGYDALAIYVHATNPMQSISLHQLAEIYGDGGEINTWSQLGVAPFGCRNDGIIRVNRQNNSGSYVYFQGAVFGGTRDFRLGTMDMNGSKEVVGLVGMTPCAIGYSSLAYATDAVRKLNVTKTEKENPVEVNLANVVNHTYPIWRPLFIYTNGEAQGEIKNYLDWIKSDSGQCILYKKGFAPIRDVRC